MSSQPLITTADPQPGLPAYPSRKSTRVVPTLMDSYKEMVTVISKCSVATKDEEPGYSPETYIVHKAFAVYYSRMLDVAFNGPFLESQTQTITLRTFRHPKEFGIIIIRFYTQCFDVEALMAVWTKFFPELRLDSMYYYFWIKADEQLMPELQNHIMRKLFSLKESLMAEDHGDYFKVMIKDNTTQGSKLRGSACAGKE